MTNFFFGVTMPIETKINTNNAMQMREKTNNGDADFLITTSCIGTQGANPHISRNLIHLWPNCNL